VFRSLFLLHMAGEAFAQRNNGEIILRFLVKTTDNKLRATKPKSEDEKNRAGCDYFGKFSRFFSTALVSPCKQAKV
jgi:hypothetical protein